MIEQTCIRPWGKWEVLDVGEFYKVKKLTILPGQAISAQYHNHRTETWCVTQGSAQVILESKNILVHRGDVFSVAIGETHQVTNISERENFIAIEVQMGELCDENDIVRI